MLKKFLFPLIAALAMIVASPAWADDDDGLDIVADEGVEDAKMKEFFVTFDMSGEEKTIAFAGPFEVFARCNSTTFDQIQIVVTSSVAGWFEQNATTTPQAAGEERVILAQGAKAFFNPAVAVKLETQIFSRVRSVP